MLNGQYGDDTAADVQKSAEGLQPNDPAAKHTSRDQVRQEESHGLFLGLPAAQQGHRGAFGVGGDAFYCKASLLANS